MFGPEYGYVLVAFQWYNPLFSVFEFLYEIPQNFARYLWPACTFSPKTKSLPIPDIVRQRGGTPFGRAVLTKHKDKWTKKTATQIEILRYRNVCKCHRDEMPRVDHHLLTLIIAQLSDRLDLLYQLVFVLLQFNQCLLQFLPVWLLLLKVQFLHCQCILQLLQSHTYLCITCVFYTATLMKVSINPLTHTFIRTTRHTPQKQRFPPYSNKTR